jgi:uncharacterized protein (DUF1330 family)
MCSFFIAQIKIHDWDEYEKYLEGYDRIFRKYNGEIMAVEDSPTALEGTWALHTNCCNSISKPS